MHEYINMYMWSRKNHLLQHTAAHNNTYCNTLQHTATLVTLFCLNTGRILKECKIAMGNVKVKMPVAVFNRIHLQGVHIYTY